MDFINDSPDSIPTNTHNELMLSKEAYIEACELNYTMIEPRKQFSENQLLFMMFIDMILWVYLAFLIFIELL